MMKKWNVFLYVQIDAQKIKIALLFHLETV